MPRTDRYLDATLAPGWLGDLRERCLDEFGSPAIWDVLVAAYTELHRAYHTPQHLAAMFAQYDRVELYLGPAARAVRWAIWFHDAVYSTAAAEYASNEVRSAALMRELLAGQPDASAVLEVAEALVLATASHSVPEQFPAGSVERRACELFLDIDLAILACRPSQVALFDAGVRREFAQYSEAEFAAGRIQVLESFFARERVFLSDVFVPQEQAARANLTELLRTWRARMAR